MTTEPVRIVSLVNAAMIATLAILLFFDVEPDLVAGIGVAVTAWIAVVGELVRSKVSPVDGGN